jgi:hypothetical protein
MRPTFRIVQRPCWSRYSQNGCNNFDMPQQLTQDISEFRRYLFISKYIFKLVETVKSKRQDPVMKLHVIFEALIVRLCWIWFELPSSPSGASFCVIFQNPMVSLLHRFWCRSFGFGSLKEDSSTYYSRPKNNFKLYSCSLSMCKSQWRDLRFDFVAF